MPFWATQHLMRKELTDPKLLHYQEMIEESGSLLLSIINNVLDMTKIESGRLELNEDYNRVGDVVGKIVAVFQGEARKKNLTLTRVQKATNLDILCDVTKLQELFTNLISNAVKYTPPGGTVTVTTEELPCAQPGHVTLRTEVADTASASAGSFCLICLSPSPESGTPLRAKCWEPDWVCPSSGALWS